VRPAAAGEEVEPAVQEDARRDEAALVDAGVALGQALASGAMDAFPRRPEDPAACERLGCGYVGRCWGPAPAHS